MRRWEADGPASVERYLQFCLLGLVGTGFLALAGSGRLDALTIAAVALGLTARGLAVAGVFRLEFQARALTIATAAYAAFFLADLLWLSRDLAATAVHLVFFLALVKILTARPGRDSLQVAGIAILELLAAALVSIDFNFLLALGLYLIFAIAALNAAEILRSMSRAAPPRGALRRLAPRLALLACAVAGGILALTSGLFFLLPRTADAALSGLARPAVLPGFTEQVTLGQIGEIKRSTQAAMHLRIFSSQPLGSLKWRGAALSDFDGRRWSEPGTAVARIPVRNGHVELAANPYGFGRHLSYQVEYDSLESRTLFFAGSPEKLDFNYPFVERAKDGNYSAPGGPRARLRYEAYSRLEDPPESAPPRRPAPVLSLEARERNLELPEPLDGRIPALAVALAGAGGSDLARARAIEAGLRRQYRYSLSRVNDRAPDPLAHFLFDSRSGHCEYFASAMAVLLRTLDIPARVATGFQGGEYNPITDLWVVRASDAHSWVEAWIPDYGWTTFDPTPADPNAGGSSALAPFGLYLDAARTFWRNWVVGYNAGRQGALADRFEEGAEGIGIHWFDAVSRLELAWRFCAQQARGRAAIPIVLAACLGLSSWLWAPPLLRAVRWRRRVERVRRGHAEGDDATVLYRRLLTCLTRKGYEKPAWFTPIEFARALPGGRLGGAVQEFTAAYNALRFGGRVETAARLSALLEELERARDGP